MLFVVHVFSTFFNVCVVVAVAVCVVEDVLDVVDIDNFYVVFDVDDFVHAAVVVHVSAGFDVVDFVHAAVSPLKTFLRLLTLSIFVSFFTLSTLSILLSLSMYLSVLT